MVRGAIFWNKLQRKFYKGIYNYIYMEIQKIEMLSKNIESVKNLVKSLGVPEEILVREVKSFGNGSHVILPKEHLNKKVKIIVE